MGQQTSGTAPVVAETRRTHREKITLEAEVTGAGPRRYGKQTYEPRHLIVQYSRDGSPEVGLHARLIGPRTDGAGDAWEDMLEVAEAPEWVRSFVADNHPWEDTK